MTLLTHNKTNNGLTDQRAGALPFPAAFQSQRLGAGALQGRFGHSRLFSANRFGTTALRQLLGKSALLASMALLAPTAVHANPDDVAGAELAFKYHCTTCHGEGGRSTAVRYPKIAGQTRLYLESRLKYFRDGVEPGNQMNAQAAPLSDDDIAILSDYYSRQAP